VSTFQKPQKKIEEKNVQPSQSSSSQFVTQRDETRVAPKYQVVPPALLLNKKISKPEKTQSEKAELSKSTSPLPKIQVAAQHKPKPPAVITTKTLRSALDGTPDTRAVVGVGEEVEMRLPKSAAWSASAGTIFPLQGSKVVWTAPATEMYADISAKLPSGQKCSYLMQVEAPNALSFTKKSEKFILNTHPGAGMECQMTILPSNVCFGATQLREDPGPATVELGFFKKYPIGDHHPNPAYAPFDDTNINVAFDTAATDITPPPVKIAPAGPVSFKIPRSGHSSLKMPPLVGTSTNPYFFGYCQWVIPNRYKLDSEPDSNGRVFTKTIQAFTIDEFGTVTVSKAGAVVSRKLKK
jgi:hypothetical protein